MEGSGYGSLRHTRSTRKNLKILSAPVSGLPDFSFEKLGGMNVFLLLCISKCFYG
jgi:hypothetical protein